MEIENQIFVTVILPLRLRMEISYSVPQEYINVITRGSRVKVLFSGREYIAVVYSLKKNCGDYRGRVLDISGLADGPKVTEEQLSFWEWISQYYMCSIGEVYKATYTAAGEVPATGTRARKTGKEEERKFILSDAQQRAKDEIRDSFSESKPALLAGITGSGKTEIYMSIAKEEIASGGVVLYMVPEIALSRQLEERLHQVFGERLVTFHSALTPAKRRDTSHRISGIKDGEGLVVLGLRSSILLPFKRLSLIIIDEEHDPSYKQNEPAPRYSARDAAIVLANIYKANVLLGSATPSFESIYNSKSGRYNIVYLKERYFGAGEPEIEIIDMIKERKARRVNGIFSVKTLSEIDERISRGEQILIFRNRRSYSPMVQCSECGYIPLCSHCNTSLSYHKNRRELCCHYCDFHIRFTPVCPQCGKGTLTERGTGTEMIAEKISEHFPNAKVERFDAETTTRKSEEKRMLKDFAAGKTDILVGTQMISKGFDFRGLSLVVIIHADSMLALDDFRANERAFQLLEQLSGRTGRGSRKGKIIVQTALGEHPVYESFSGRNNHLYEQLSERKDFGYPPFVRMLKLTVRSKERNIVSIASLYLGERLRMINGVESSGPFTPVVDKIRGEYISYFWIKLPRTGNNKEKRGIEEIVSETEKKFSGVTLIPDVDPQ